MTMNDVVPSKLAKIELFMETLWVKLAFKLRRDAAAHARKRRCGRRIFDWQICHLLFPWRAKLLHIHELRWGEGEKTKTKNQ